MKRVMVKKVSAKGGAKNLKEFGDFSVYCLFLLVTTIGER